jgi:succinoglycan biosynthesis protein ExoM
MDPMNSKAPHISVCICTYKRPGLLRRLLTELGRQGTAGRFTFSIVIADNDYMRSAEGQVSDFAKGSPIPVTYCVEPTQNISLARNRAIKNASGDFIAFIDDDELPSAHWLLTLFSACHKYGVDGVLGPVHCRFDEEPPQWVIKGKFYERPTYPTGLVIDWTKGRTGNVLLKKSVFDSDELLFNPAFHRAGDQDCFRRLIAKGYVFVWCNEAAAYEIIPPARWTRRFMLKRALLRGTIGTQHPTPRLLRTSKALIAIPLYTVVLPIALLLGQDAFMNILVRLVDHAAFLLAAIGIKPIHSQLLTD